MNNSTLQAVLGKNVLEVVFRRRHESLGWSPMRGLLGTTNYDVLNGDFGQQVLRFQPPKGIGMGYDYKSKGLCVVWDFFREEYRVFGAEEVEIRQVFDVTTEPNRQYFREWFYQYIIYLTKSKKLAFMGYKGPAYASRQLASRQRLRRR